MGFAGTGRAYEDNVLLVFDELKGFKFFEFWQKRVIVFASHKIHKILFQGEFCLFDPPDLTV